jgi:hypothetical protein
MTMARWANNRCADAETCVGDPACPSFVGSQRCQEEASRIPARTLAWPVYLSDTGVLTCNHSDCPENTDLFDRLVGRRHTVHDLLQAIHTHAVTVPHERNPNMCVNTNLPECKGLEHPHPVGPQNGA